MNPLEASRVPSVSILWKLWLASLLFCVGKKDRRRMRFMIGRGGGGGLEKKSADSPEYCLLIPTRGVMIDSWAAEDPELKF